MTWKLLAFSVAAVVIDAALLVAIVLAWATKNSIVVW